MELSDSRVKFMYSEGAKISNLNHLPRDTILKMTHGTSFLACLRHAMKLNVLELKTRFSSLVSILSSYPMHLSRRPTMQSVKIFRLKVRKLCGK